MLKIDLVEKNKKNQYLYKSKIRLLKYIHLILLKYKFINLDLHVR